MWAMNWKGILAAVLAVILAVVLIAAFATASIVAEVSGRQGTPTVATGTPGVVTSTVIPAPEVMFLKCVRGMDGFYCEEVTEVCR